MRQAAGEPPLDPVWQMRVVLHGLDAMHGWRDWVWDGDSDPFEVCVGAILVQNTAWENVELALARLREAGALTPAGMMALDDEALEYMVQPSGSYRQKARKLREFLALCEAAGSFEALMALPGPALRERLLDTWGIGEETADAILLYAAGEPAFVIDAFTRRVFGRLGTGPQPDAGYERWQDHFTSILDPDAETWGRIHALIVLHAKHICRKRQPECNRCVLHHRCASAPEFLAAAGR